ncbi:MAG: TolC family protein, partial [Blastocatellia bacterium]
MLWIGLAVFLLNNFTTFGQAQNQITDRTNRPVGQPQKPPPPAPDTGNTQQSGAAVQPPPPVQTGPPIGLISREQAVQLAIAQASVYEEAKYNELIAKEDVKQARSAFLPIISIPGTVTYNSPAGGPEAVVNGVRQPAFINSNAITEYIAGVNVGGDIDINGRLRASLRRANYLLQAAHAGTEAARRALIEAVDEAYFGLAGATARRRSAELNLTAAETFENITQLLLNGGEVASVDLDRARLQTSQRRDELQQSIAAEEAAADSLKAFIGYDFGKPVAAADLLSQLPRTDEVEHYT